MSTTAGAGRSPMRARFREQVRENVKSVALVQLADGGAGALSVNAIAKELGVSGPALYRYFTNRDELLAELVVDAYHDLAAWQQFMTAAGFAELLHYYRPPGLPREQQPWLASVWRNAAD